MGPKILIVDDDEQILTQMDWALREEFQVYRASDRRSALASLRAERPALVILDLGLPPHPREASEGLAAVEEILRVDPKVKVIIISGNSDRENALRAIRAGACDYFSKPVDLEELKVVIGRAIFLIDLTREQADKQAAQPGEAFEELLGTSPPMLEVFQKIAKVAPVDVPVLITGESGTGKELIARAIYRRGPRRQESFVPINCGAIPGPLLESELFGHEKGAFTGATAQRKGKLEEAQGGTLFLDEIGELELGLQVKLLRFLQDGVIERVGGRERIHLNTRFIAATNRNLKVAVEKGSFREDLYYRLAVVQIVVPPLRQRSADLLLLASSFLRKYKAEYRNQTIGGFTPQAEDAIVAYSWPGNVRELENRIKRAVVLADGPIISPTELELTPETLGEGSPGDRFSMKQAKENLEREMVQRAMAETGGNISKAAKLLGISRPTLYEILEKLGLQDSKS